MGLLVTNRVGYRKELVRGCGCISEQPTLIKYDSGPVSAQEGFVTAAVIGDKRCICSQHYITIKHCLQVPVSIFAIILEEFQGISCEMSAGFVSIFIILPDFRVSRQPSGREHLKWNKRQLRTVVGLAFKAHVVDSAVQYFDNVTSCSEFSLCTYLRISSIQFSMTTV